MNNDKKLLRLWEILELPPETKVREAINSVGTKSTSITAMFAKELRYGSFCTDSILNCRFELVIEPRKPREIYVNEYPSGIAQVWHPTEKIANSERCSHCIRCVKFVEVIEEGGES